MILSFFSTYYKCVVFIKKYKDYKVYAWCKPTSLPLLLEKGFVEGETCVYVEKKIAK